MMYTVSEMARRMGLAPSTLRYYDREGLLPFVERTPGGVRMFSDEDARWLNLIGCLKQAGMPLKDIRRYIHMTMDGDETVDERLSMFHAQRDAVRRQLAELQHVLDVVEYKCWYYETAQAAGSADVPRDMADEQVPEQFRAVRRSLRGED